MPVHHELVVQMFTVLAPHYIIHVVSVIQTKIEGAAIAEVFIRHLQHHPISVRNRVEVESHYRSFAEIGERHSQPLILQSILYSATSAGSPPLCSYAIVILAAIGICEAEKLRTIAPVR